jgi:pyruvate/2-oxoglutarate dehydrogenase complex dihydrolipoamide acyltransferase (E2) component
MLEKDNSLAVRLTWDHRVFDGATAARALTDFEQILTREMVREIEGPIRLVA